MASLRRFLRRLLNAVRPARAESDLAREMASHVALLEEHYRHRGMTPADARRAAALAFGGVELAKDRHRDARSFAWLDDLRRDLQYGMRTLVRAPGFTVVVVGTLALGIGANTAIFSVVHAVLLRPLPYKDSNRLVRVYENVPGTEFGNGKGPDRRFGAMDIRDVVGMSGRTRTLTHLATLRLAQMAMTINGDTTRMDGFGVSPNFFDMLGVPPAIGRTITDGDAAGESDHVVVLGYDTWKRYGGAPNIIGKVVKFSGGAGTFTGGLSPDLPYTVIGVMPAEFRFPYENPQFWFPRRPTAPGTANPGQRFNLEAIARLASSATPEAAAAEMGSLRDDLRGASAPNGRPRYELVPLLDELTSPVRPALLVLTGAVGIVLLIACVNVANLLLARTASRQREIAVRTAIGAGRGRLVRQLLTESVLLSAFGGAAGTLFAFWGVRFFRGLGATLGRVDLGATAVFPRLNEVTVDGTVFVYALALSIAIGMLFGIVPALRHSRGDRLDVLRESMGTTRSRMRDLLVIAEMALAMLLLVVSGLLINSFIKLATVDPGFDASRLLTFQVLMSGSPGNGAQRTFAERVIERFQSIPGVQSAAYARQLPMVQLQDTLTLTIRRNGADQTLGTGADIRFVSRDYLQAMGIPLVAGRGLGVDDGAGRPGVVVINEALAHRDFAGVNPIGEVILLGPSDHRLPFEIVGVARNVRQFGLDRIPDAQYFIDIRQVPTDPVYRMPPLFPVGVYYTLRTVGDPQHAINGVRTVIRQLDPNAALDHVATMEQIVSNSLVRPRMYAVLAGIFSGVAVALAAIGLYGVLAYAVTQRTREIGIRMALGAQRREVMRLVLGQSAMLAAIGLAVGLAAAAGATRYLEGMLFGVTPLDPATFVVVAIAFALVAIVASYVPARRATRVDPLEALRFE
jgi:putative ABC transport system permease protein